MLDRPVGGSVQRFRLLFVLFGLFLGGWVPRLRIGFCGDFLCGLRFRFFRLDLNLNLFFGFLGGFLSLVPRFL